MIFKVKILFILDIFLIFQSIFHVCQAEVHTKLSNPFMTKDNSPGITAVLLECPKRTKKPSPSDKFHGNPCENQLLINVRVNPSSDTEPIEKFLILDELYRPRKRIKLKILSPYLIHITRGEPVMMYPLQFTKQTKINHTPKIEVPTTPPQIQCKKIGEESTTKCPSTLPGQIKCGGTESKAPVDYAGKCGEMKAPVDYAAKCAEMKAKMCESRVGASKCGAARPRYGSRIKLKPDKFMCGTAKCGSSNRIATPPGYNINLPGISNAFSLPMKHSLKRVGNVGAEENSNQRASNSFGKQFKDVLYENSLSGSPFTNAAENDFSSGRQGLFPYLQQNSQKSSMNYNILQDPINVYENSMSSDYNFLNNVKDNIKQSVRNIDKTNFKNVQPYSNTKSSIASINRLENDFPNRQQNDGLNKYYGSMKQVFTRDQVNNEFYSGYSLSDMWDLPKESGTNTLRHTNNQNMPESSQIAKNPFFSYNRDFNFGDKLKDDLIHKVRNRNELRENVEHGVKIKPNYDASFSGVDNVPTNYLLHRFPLASPMEERLSRKNHVLDEFDKENFLPASFSLKPKTKKVKRSPENELQLEMPLEDSENRITFKSNRKIPEMESPNAPRANGEEDVQSCNSCGGKNKKPPDKDKPKLKVENANNAMPNENADYQDLLNSVENEIININAEIHDYDTEFDTVNAKRAINSQLTLSPSKNSRNDRGNEQDILPCRRCYQHNGNALAEIVNSKGPHCNCRMVKADCNCNDLKPIRTAEACNATTETPECTTEAFKCTTQSPNNYLEFKMNNPLPLLASKVRVYRKRTNRWWRIAPEMTLDSFSGVYSSENFSIIFSAHVDIYQLQKSARLKSVKLLLPSSAGCAPSNIFDSIPMLNENPDLILAYDDSRSLRNDRHNKYARDDLNEQPESAGMNGLVPMTAAFTSNLEELGMRPKVAKILEPCKNDKSVMCLNLIDDKVPEYVMKIKMPFRENTIIDPAMLHARIATVVTDATTKDVLQISVDVINKGLETRKFSISISKCSMKSVSSARTVVSRTLAPYIRETVIFLLPLIDPNQKHKKFSCLVRVKSKMLSNLKLDEDDSDRDRRFLGNSESMVLVAERAIKVEPGLRCVCVWKCKCHCVPKLETHVDFNLCQLMLLDAQEKAGLLIYCDKDDTECPPSLRPKTKTFYKLLRSSFIMSSILFLLGLIKALLGLAGCEKIDRFGYDCIQPQRRYECASKKRRFFYNSLFFLMYPLAFWSYCCLRTEEDRLISTTEWTCSRKSKSRNQNRAGITGERLSADLRASERPRSKGGYSGYNDLYLDMRHDIRNSLFDDFEDDDENTKYVLQILDESRSSLKSLMNEHLSSTSLSVMTNDQQIPREAIDYVQSLQTARIVYRILDQPVGNVQKIPPGIKYCVQGYFLKAAAGEAYEFTNYYPLYQHRCFSSKGNTVKALYPPLLLQQDTFKHVYRNKMSVFVANDLLLVPPENIECINMSTMASLATSIISLTSDLQNISGTNNESNEYNLRVPDDEAE